MKKRIAAIKLVPGMRVLDVAGDSAMVVRLGEGQMRGWARVRLERTGIEKDLDVKLLKVATVQSGQEEAAQPPLKPGEFETCPDCGGAPCGCERAKKLAKKPVNEARPLGTPAAPKAPKAAKAQQPKAEPVVKTCLCGCGATTKSFFVMGHDARFHGWLKKIALGKLDPATLNPATVKLMNLRAGKPTTDWDGEAWSLEE